MRPLSETILQRLITARKPGREFPPSKQNLSQVQNIPCTSCFTIRRMETGSVTDLDPHNERDGAAGVFQALQVEETLWVVLRGNPQYLLISNVLMLPWKGKLWKKAHTADFCLGRDQGRGESFLVQWLEGCWSSTPIKRSKSQKSPDLLERVRQSLTLLIIS